MGTTTSNKIEMMRFKAFTLISFLFLNCQSSVDKTKKHLLFNDSSWVEIRGDSIKIDYQRRNDTLIQHFIDLKGISDDGFDSSFWVKSVFSVEKPHKLDCELKTTIRYDSLDFIFCRNELINYVDSISKASLSMSFQFEWLRDSLDKNVHHVEILYEYYPFELIRRIPYQITDLQKQKRVDKIIVESYET